MVRILLVVHFPMYVIMCLLKICTYYEGALINPSLRYMNTFVSMYTESWTDLDFHQLSFQFYSFCTPSNNYNLDVLLYLQAAVVVAVLNVYIPLTLGGLVNVIAGFEGGRPVGEYFHQLMQPGMRLALNYLAQVWYVCVP